MRTGYRLLRAAPAALLSLAVGLSVLARPASAAPTGCAAALDGLARELSAIGFIPPTKPAQSVVWGRNGQHVTGGEYAFMTTEMRLAARACAADDPQDPMPHLAAVRAILDRAAAKAQ